MSAQPVDVLSVLLTASENADDYVGQRAAMTLREVREAVAELIEAAHLMLNDESWDAEQRLAAALARCGGTP